MLFTIAGMVPLKPYFLGVETPPHSAPDDLPEDVPHVRHRDHRHDHAPPDVLRDARQLLARGLLQARRGRVRLGALARGLLVPGAADLDHGIRRRRRARPRSRPGGDRRVAGDRRPARADRRVRPRRELLADGPDRSRVARARSCISTAASSSASPTTCPAATTSASSSTGTWCSWSSTRTPRGS